MEHHDLFGGPGSVIGAPERAEVSAEDKASALPLLDKAMLLVLQRWSGFIDGESNGFISPDLTDGIAAWYFVRAKYFGATYPRYLSVVFCPEQLATVGDHGSIVALLRGLVNGTIVGVASIEWALMEDCRFNKLISSGLGFRQGHRLPLDFPANTARILIDHFCPQGGSVLDPCHGWGGRLVGFLLSSKAKRYVGLDPSPHAHAALKRIWATLHPYAEKEKTAKIVRKPFEDVAPMGPLFDLALTSPPYYDSETYAGEEQSHVRYKSFEEWCEGFYHPLFQKTYDSLKPGAHFLINVGSQQYPLIELARDYGEWVGFTHVRTRQRLLLPGYNGTSADRGESLVILRK